MAVYFGELHRAMEFPEGNPPSSIDHTRSNFKGVVQIFPGTQSDFFPRTTPNRRYTITTKENGTARVTVSINSQQPFILGGVQHFLTGKKVPEWEEANTWRVDEATPDILIGSTSTDPKTHVRRCMVKYVVFYEDRRDRLGLLSH